MPTKVTEKVYLPHVEKELAALLGKKVVAGPAAGGNGQLAAYAAAQGVQVITENFRATAERADQLLAILDLCAGEVGLCADFGNFKGAQKYAELAAIAPQADSAHAKAIYDGEGHPDRAELTRCLDVMAAAGFDGPISLIFDTPFHRGEDEWDNLAVLRKIVLPYTN